MAKANERFRLVWSSSRSDWMIAPETAKGIGAPATVSNAPVSTVVEGCLISGCHSLTSHAQKLVAQFAAHNKKTMLQSLASLRLSTAIALMFAGVAPSVVAQALQDPTVRSGTATIDLSNTNHAVITQQSNKAIIDWRQFSIPSGSTVQFVQPSASSMMLNRVTGTQASQIDGNLLANGQVWLLNPSGVMIGNGGSINTASFLASTLDINNNDFLNGRYRFDATSNTTGRVVNAGTIKAAENGYVVLSGKQINNEGVIEAKLGSVLLGSGQAMTLDLVGDKLLSFAINTPVATLPTDGKASIENSGRITAQGGKVMMTARTATDVMHSVINVSGVVDATSAKLVNGEIVLDGGSTGSVTVSGSLLAHGLQAGETGGAIKVFGKDINVANNAVLDARGDAGGGVIHVGGGWQGSGLAGRTAALTTQVGSNALLDASAINKGNGGEIAIWSDIHNKQSITNVSGTLLAKAGATLGNGGRIETSGYLLGTTGIRVDASATKGLSGEWLIDPFNISIESNAGASVINNGTFFPTNASVINATTINDALNSTVA
ncbi:MAG: filamentous hemagglutinin N-terminal domain-containing protein, partial [Burkholderiales bacterium]|nr:filamentous hemagglutinin N-terminal domain-containing protein [Burkholderiales bacterium]